jgi:chemotaxis methyl-accepting protein methylase
MPLLEQNSNSENERSYQRLVNIIQEELHFNCHDYNEAYIRRRLNARMLANNLPQDDYAAYIKTIRILPDEIKKLYDALTINVTQFFRDSKLWEVLAKDVLPNAIAEKKDKMGKIFSVWSCGCASGEEPYSLAILFKELVKDREILPKITATDIDETSLKRCREGVYGANALKSTPKDYISRYFRRSIDGKGNEKFELDMSVRSQVQFYYHNAITQMPPGTNFDMIFCRNVIIYFTQETKNRLIDTFHGALGEHGWLVIGKSEVLFTAKAQNRFYVYNGAESIYRKDRRNPSSGPR